MSGKAKNVIDFMNEVYEDAARNLLKATEGKMHVPYYTLLELLKQDYKSIDIKIRKNMIIHYTDSEENEAKKAITKFLS